MEHNEKKNYIFDATNGEKLLHLPLPEVLSHSIFTYVLKEDSSYFSKILGYSLKLI